MTVDSRSELSVPAPGPSVHVVRARKLLLGGLIGGVGASVISVVILTLVYGRSGLVSSLLAAGMVLFFYGVGQLVMVGSPTPVRGRC